MVAARKPRRRRPAIFEEPSATDTFVVAVVRLGLRLNVLLDDFLKPYEITLLQFNVLRILYVNDPEFAGIPSGMIGARMVARVPDVPRLIDRLVKGGLVERTPSAEDRRVVLVRLTQKGVDRMEETFPMLIEHNRRLLGSLPARDLVELAAALDRVRALVHVEAKEG
jgi:DNA-binding MarR family transcriptional regulator